MFRDLSNLKLKTFDLIIFIQYLNGHYGRNDGYVHHVSALHLKVVVTHQLYSYSESLQFSMTLIIIS